MRFVLVHGGYHGAWCWTRVIDELTRHGHSAVAVDLPGHGERRLEDQSVDGYRAAVVDQLRSGDVLVAHSMGCAVATLAVDAFSDVRHLCLIAGPVPFDGEPLVAIAGSTEEFIAAAARDQEQTVRVEADGDHLWMDFDDARMRWYGDCSDDDARWAYERLVPQRASVMFQPVSLPRFWDLDVRRSYLRCRDDRAFIAQHSTEAVRRLRISAVELPSSHSPFLSMPKDLVDTILHAVAAGDHVVPSI